MKKFFSERVTQRLTYPTYAEWRREFEQILYCQNINLESLVAINESRETIKDVIGAMKLIKMADGRTLYEAVPSRRVYDSLLYSKNIHVSLETVMEFMAYEDWSTPRLFLEKYNRTKTVNEFMAMLMSSKFEKVDLHLNLDLLWNCVFDIEEKIEENEYISKENKTILFEELLEAFYKIESKVTNEFITRWLDHAIGKLGVNEDTKYLAQVLQEIQEPYLLGDAC